MIAVTSHEVIAISSKPAARHSCRVNNAAGFIQHERCGLRSRGFALPLLHQRALANDGFVSGAPESNASPRPMRDVQWGDATIGCVPEDKRFLGAPALVVEVAPVPVPMLAVQWGDAGMPWEELVTSACAA